MSISEFIVVIIIAVLVMKPQDIAVVLKKFMALKKSFNKLQVEILGYLAEPVDSDPQLMEQAKKINFYLKTIIDLEGSYDGDYCLEAIEQKYNQLIKNNTKSNENISSTDQS